VGRASAATADRYPEFSPRVPPLVSKRCRPIGSRRRRFREAVAHGGFSPDAMGCTDCYRGRLTIMATSVGRVLLILVALSFVNISRAADAPRDIWLLSTRDASHCSASNEPANAIRYWRLDANCGWAAADAKDFQDGEASQPTVVFVHGNYTDPNEAVTKGMYAYESIREGTGCRPFRYVIWSWPAARVCRRHRGDAQLKVGYSDIESYYFATWLNGLRPGTKLSLVGHSFGPRIIAGALHILAGGEVAGQRMPDEAVRAWTEKKRNPIRAVLLAMADDFDSLAPDGRAGRALSLLDRVLVTRNGCDSTLRWYPRLYGRGGPDAVGFTGPCGVGEPEKVTVIDVCCTVGKTHDYQYYCSASNVCSRWAQYTFLDDAAEKP
jgi:hypothetical protein